MEKKDFTISKSSEIKIKTKNISTEINYITIHVKNTINCTHSRAITELHQYTEKHICSPPAVDHNAGNNAKITT